MTTREIFIEVRELNLPLGAYAITSSGPLGVRGIREINDADLIAKDDLYNQLKVKFGERAEKGIKKVVVSPTVEVFYEGSFKDKLAGEPSVAEQIVQAEIIDGLPFVSLRHVIFYKQAMGRDKDKKDLQLIKAWQERQ